MKKLITFLFIIFSLNVSAQGTITWNMGMNIAPSSSGNHHPRIAVDAAGNPLVIWGHSNRVMISRWNGTAFTAPVMLNPMTLTIAEASWMGPQIATHGDTVYVVVKQTPEASDTCHIYCLHSYNGGLTFSMPVQVDYIADSLSRFPTVNTDDLGNPIVGFMKFNPTFGEARWVVCRSTDFGNTFSTDVKASGWSSATSTVCDCCPGSITSSGNTVAVLYRDNNNNIRDSWAGISTNGGITFTSGFNIDQNNWMLMQCPATGPDGFIMGDTLYSVFMNGASGLARTYYSKASISNAAAAVIPVTGNIPGLTEQNFPRIASDGNAVAIVWSQTVSGNSQLPVLFTNDIANGFPLAYDTVDLNDVTNTDVAISNGNIFIVWEDDNSGTVKYRSGSFTQISAGINEVKKNKISVFPNPVKNELQIMNYNLRLNDKIEIYNVFGSKISEKLIFSPATSVNVSEISDGIYFLKILSGDLIFVSKFVKQ